MERHVKKPVSKHETAWCIKQDERSAVIGLDSYLIRFAPHLSGYLLLIGLIMKNYSAKINPSPLINRKLEICFGLCNLIGRVHESKFRCKWQRRDCKSPVWFTTCKVTSTRQVPKSSVQDNESDVARIKQSKLVYEP